jgi:PAS domain S-box-containing protein
VADPHRVTPSESASGADHDSRVDELAARLSQAEEMIRAIRFGEVDALVVNGPRGAQVYALEGADHPYRVLVEQMHEGTVTLDPHGLILYCNRQFAAMVGRPLESVLGSNFNRFTSPVSSNEFAEMIEAARGGHAGGDLLLRDAKNEMIPVHLSLTPLDRPDLSATCVVVSDLRERRRNESLAKEEQLSRMILEQAGEAIVVIDPQGVIVRRSKSAKALCHRAVLLAYFDRAFPLHAAGEPLDSKSILEAAREGHPVRGVEASMMSPDGHEMSLLVSASPLWLNSSELLGCVITLIDITDRKRAEDVLARQADELERSNSDLRQFAYSASHDLREPVRQLAVFSELLQKKYQEALGGEGAYLIQHAVDSAHRVEKLLQDLLAYVQAADAPQHLLALVDAGEVVRKTLSTFAERIEETGAQVECGPLPKLAMHEIHLIQLIQNLMSNALKYRGEATPLIRIRAENQGPMCTFSVEDNGIGIRPEYQAQIFGLFRRLHGGDRYSGSGIGLAICQKIVQRYGGRIWVESEAGRGSKFVFTLPGGNA